MKRRELLAGVVGAGVTGGAAWVAVNGLGGGGGSLATVDTLEARGSTAGTQRIPVPGTVTVVDLFATWCAPCRAQMDALATVHEELGDRAAFVSVTNESFENGLTAADVREWWRRNHGNWTLGHDPDSTIHRALGAGGIPFTAVIDRSGTVTFTHRGIVSTESLRSKVAEVL